MKAVDSEKYILGLLLLDSQLMTKLPAQLSVADFTDTRHQTLFMICQVLYKLNGYFESADVLQRLRADALRHALDVFELTELWDKHVLTPWNEYLDYLINDLPAHILVNIDAAIVQQSEIIICYAVERKIKSLTQLPEDRAIIKQLVNMGAELIERAETLCLSRH